jgi:hypothetical protein
MADVRPLRLVWVSAFAAGMMLSNLVGAAPLAAAAPVAPSQASTAAPADLASEADQLHRALIEEVPDLRMDSSRAAQAWIARTEAAIAAQRLAIDRPQLLVVVDRNPRVQQFRLILALPRGAWVDLGGSVVSTGEPGRYNHFLTPTGIFLHSDAILDYRAEGTYNRHHIRGLGERGMRVWDFGWQEAVRGWRSTRKVSRMRLLLHSTDPATLAHLLGQPASDGCIRIPAAVNRFLDRNGVLDADYEAAARENPARFAALLLPDRTPTPLAGDKLVVIDSSEPRTQRIASRTG